MKKIIIILIAMLTTQVFAAAKLKCTVKSFRDYHALYISSIQADCFDKDDHYYSLYFEGIGPGLKASTGKFRVKCPLVKKDNIRGVYKGLKLSASAGLGLKGGVVFGKKLKTCFIGGVEIGAGASVAIGKLTID